VARFISLQYADLVYNGLWFTPTRDALDAFVETVQERVTGTVRLRLFKGDCRIVGRRSPFALYDHALATYDSGDRFDQSAAEGFIKIFGLPVETTARKAPSVVSRRSSGDGRRSPVDAPAVHHRRLTTVD
jgi:argininosuccinate synthase